MSKSSPESKKLDRLIQNWERYRELVMPALAGEEATDRQERMFLELKANLAAQIQWLSETLPRSMAYESHQTAEAMADLMHRHVNLTTYDMDHRWESMDFERTWHQYFIYLNRLRGTELVSPYDQSDVVRRSDEDRSATAGRFGWVLAFLFTAFLVVLVAAAAGVGWDSSGPHFEPPQDLAHAGKNASGALSMLWVGPSKLLEPVTTAYGSMWGIGMIAALAVLSGAFFVRRGQQ
jgi:hypothetical protein